MALKGTSYDKMHFIFRHKNQGKLVEKLTVVSDPDVYTGISILLCQFLNIFFFCFMKIKLFIYWFYVLCVIANSKQVHISQIIDDNLAGLCFGKIGIIFV